MQVSDEIIKVLEYLGEQFGIAIDWTSENVIPYIQELMTKFINYEIATSIAWLTLACILLILGMIVIKKAKKSKYEDAHVYVITIVAIIGLAVCLPIIIVQMCDIITAITFPEKLIYEAVIESDLLK